MTDELDPLDLLRPFPAEPVYMWPVSTRVNKPENDDSSTLEPIELPVLLLRFGFGQVLLTASSIQMCSSTEG